MDKHIDGIERAEIGASRRLVHVADDVQESFLEELRN